MSWLPDVGETTMLFLNEADVTPLLSMSDAIDTVEEVLRAQARQEALFPLRNMVAAPEGILAAMPGRVTSSQKGLGAKLVTFFPGNAERQLPTHQALIALFDPATGQPLAIIDGRYITEIRTAAVSAVATRALAVSGSRVAAILGNGVQAEAHAAALRLVMDLEDVRIWGRNRLRSETLAKTLRADGAPARALDTADAACDGADVICTVTSSAEPIVSTDAIRAGAHINAVGACTPHKRELPADLVALASIFVDSVEGALGEAGDVIMAIADGVLPGHPRLTLLADVIAGRTLGRASHDEITIFESLGIAIEDVACASLVHERALERGIGTTVRL